MPGLAPKFCVAVGPAEADLVVEDGLIWAQGRSYAFSMDVLTGLASRAAGQRLGPAKQARQPMIPGLLLALPFGQTTAAALAHLADLTAEARTTPGAPCTSPPPEDAAPYARAGFITDPADPRRTIATCPGAPACASGSTPTRADAARLAASG